MDPPSTIENASVTAEDASPPDDADVTPDTPRIEDLEAYDDVIAEGLERGAQRLAEARAAAD